MPIYIDFESASECDLPTRGAYNYARDPSTRVLCMAWAINDGEVSVWTPDQPFPHQVYDAVQHGAMIYAHNAAFERLIWTYVLGPDFNIVTPRLEQFYCTATQARANCAPGGLEDVGRFAGADMRKDHKGAALVRKCCCPPFKHTEQDLADLFDYCAQDVRAMRAISKAMRPLTNDELADYHCNERINDRGVLVDVPLAEAAQRYADVESQEIQHRVVEVTAGAVPSVRSPRMRAWVLERLGPQARKLCVVHKDGESKDSIDKSVRASLLAFDDPEEVPADVQEVIEAADALWASSVAKFKRMVQLADEDDHRVRGAFVFAGGAATGRAASYGLQLHNMVRKSAKNADTVRTAIVRGHSIVPAFGPSTNSVLKSMLRPSLMAAPGRVFINYDWSAIEARVLPWLSGEGDATLDIFRRGEDLYVAVARKMFNVQDVTPDQRQQAKVAVLACGFAGGVGAFSAMARIYGIVITEADARRMVDLWRRSNPWAPRMWQRLESAYMSALRHPGHEFHAARCTYLFDGQHLWYALPSGRVLCYPFARIDEEGVSYAKASWKPAADAKEWPRARLWVGTAAENITQATAHDILRLSLRRLDQEGFDVIAHTHDEILVECAEGEFDAKAARMREIMCEAPAWAPDLPLKVDECSPATRYS
jgi:DNA polymerase